MLQLGLVAMKKSRIEDAYLLPVASGLGRDDDQSQFSWQWMP